MAGVESVEVWKGEDDRNIANRGNNWIQRCGVQTTYRYINGQQLIIDISAIICLDLVPKELLADAKLPTGWLG